MSDRDDEKIVSLDQRRRADQERQKAELAAQARRKANGGGRPPNPPFGQPSRPGGPASAGGVASGLGRLLGVIAAGAVWGGLVVSIAVAVWSQFAG